MTLAEWLDVSDFGKALWDGAEIDMPHQGLFSFEMLYMNFV